jgi:tetratricopeptide (TPR) repeat protein
MITDFLTIVSLMMMPRTVSTFAFKPPFDSRVYSRPRSNKVIAWQQNAVLDHEEPLNALFQRAVVLQRAGYQQEALDQYQLFIKAATQCDVDPRSYAEVHVNIGGIYTKFGDREQAKREFETALRYRSIGTAHVNLALLSLQEGSRTMDPTTGLNALNTAKKHCQEAIALNDDRQSGITATRLLGDIDNMLEQANKQGQ